MFALSKIFWWVAEPANLFLIVLVLGAALSLLARANRIRRLGRGLVIGVAVAALFVSVLPVGSWLVRPLEDRFPRVEALPGGVVGLISVGGAVNQFRSQARGQVALSEGAERMTEFVALARRHPELRLIYTGGSGSLLHQEIKEAGIARRFFRDMGLDTDRIVFESDSRNTYENALYTAALVHPRRASGAWALVTSAAHMPRTVGVFRKAGFTVLPYPVDYQTHRDRLGYGAGLRTGLALLSKGVYEWIGLIAYRLLGRTDRLLPMP